MPAGKGGGTATGTGGASFATGGSRATGGTTIGSGGVQQMGSGGAGGTGGASGVGGQQGTGGSAPAVPDPYFPESGSVDQCPDASLRIRFDGPPRLGSQGKVRIFDAAAPGTPVHTLDLAALEVSDTIGGTRLQLPRPAHVHQNEVVFVLPAAGLAYGKTYFVAVDAGVVSGPDGEAVIIDDPQKWRFSTASAPPVDTSQLRVALDGIGQFCGLQRAIETAAPGATISIGPGAYFGVTSFQGKDGLRLRGDARETTLLLGVNNNNLNPSTRGRALFFAEDVSGLILENLTIHNQTPQGGSQAEALALLSCDQCTVRNSTVRSLQDTLLWSGRLYAVDSLIEGNVDYIWGTGTAFFHRVEVRTVGRKGYNVQARNSGANYGYVFVDSKLSAEPGITGDVLARIDVSAYPNSHVAYIDCELGPHIAPEGWLITGGSDTSGLRFWEYGSHDTDGNPIDTSQRAAGSRQLDASQAAQMRNPMRNHRPFLTSIALASLLISPLKYSSAIEASRLVMPIWREVSMTLGIS